MNSTPGMNYHPIAQFLQTIIIHKFMGQVVFIFGVNFFRKDHLQLLGKVVLISSFFWYLPLFVQVIFILKVRLSSLVGSGCLYSLCQVIILVITSTLLENSRFHVLKYIKASINPKLLTNFHFFHKNSTLLPLTQAFWFLIECQYLLTLIF